MGDRVEALCREARAGDVAAASELLTMFYERIFSYFRRLAGDDAEAADLTQKTFCRVWTSLPSYQARSSFSSWLHAIAHHVYVDWRRKKNVAGCQPDAWWQSCAADTPSPFENAAERDLAHQLYGWVERLEDGTREVIHLHYYQGLSLKETAEALNIATSTVKYRLREALHFLRAQAAEPKAPVH
jgi:RNA polymerase sigma-70 factor (ECF subfamily)